MPRNNGVAPRINYVTPDAAHYDHHTGFPIEGYLEHQQFAADVTMYHPTRNSLNALVAKDLRVGLCQLQRYHPDRYGTPGIPPRPTRIKRPDQTPPLRDRLAFGMLSKYFAGVRAVGYYNEYLTGTTHADGGVPQVDG